MTIKDRPSQAMKSFVLSLVRFINHLMPKKYIVKDPQLRELAEEYNNSRFYGPGKYFCNAPFSSLFVSYSGRVSPCYACKAEDSLKDKSLEDIWKGEVFESLRRRFRAGEIPDECSFCRGHLRNRNFGSILALKYDHHKSIGKTSPSIIELELGNQCQLECVMCSGELSSSIRHNREHREPVESIVKPGFSSQFDFCLPRLKAAEFTGGDPFLIPVYYELWDKIEKVNPSLNILITTNANTMSPAVEKVLAKGLKFSFNISIDSLIKDVYETIRKNGNFENAISNIGRYTEYTYEHNTSIGFLVCPLRLNAYELQDFIGFADTYGATLSYHVVFKPAALVLWTMPSDELHKLARHLKHYRFKGKDYRTRINARSYDALVELVECWAQKAEQREHATHSRLYEIDTRVANAKRIFIRTLQALYPKAEDFDAVIDRLEDLVSSLKVESSPHLVFIRLASKKPQEIWQALEFMSDEEITAKLLSYHNSVYYEYYAGDGLSDNDKYELNMKGKIW
jgi:MoaA/NifB/PqqE/SkfB family radical SAM enzyme